MHIIDISWLFLVVWWNTLGHCLFCSFLVGVRPIPFLLFTYFQLLVFRLSFSYCWRRFCFLWILFFFCIARIPWRTVSPSGTCVLWTMKRFTSLFCPYHFRGALVRSRPGLVDEWLLAIASCLDLHLPLWRLRCLRFAVPSTSVILL